MSFARKKIRLSIGHYSGKRLYFVTICCNHRAPIFCNPGAVSLALDILHETSVRHGFAIHAYCFMPDHLHLLLEGLAATSFLPRLLSDFKQHSAFQYRRTYGTVLWQSKYYDHILRRSDLMESIAWYIWRNPVRKGLSAGPWDYPFSGSCTVKWGKHAAPACGWTPPWKKAVPG